MKSKAYYINDKDSFYSLMKKLENKNYLWADGKRPTKSKYENNLVIYPLKEKL